MDAERFDRLTRNLADGFPRRTLLRALTGGVTALLVGTTRGGRARAQDSASGFCRQLPPGQRGRCRSDAATGNEQGLFAQCEGDPERLCQAPDGSFACCGTDEDCCGGACVDLSTDANCGRCGNSCTGGSYCVDGGCCLPLQRECDPFNDLCCHDGGRLCSFGANSATQQGEARCCSSQGGICTGRLDCCDNYDCQGGVCCGGAGAVQCLSDDECCDGVVCRDTICCFPEGTSCTFDSECCGGATCTGGVCTPVCLGKGAECSTLSAQACCAGYECSGSEPPLFQGVCCGLAGAGQCSTNGDCCAGSVCEFDRCCVPEDAACSASGECCEGMTCRGGSCQFSCPIGTFECGATCCPFGQDCSNGTCRCLGLRETCDSNANGCCQDQPTFCPADNPFGNRNTCCRPQGGQCATAADCCNEVYDTQWGRDSCGTDGLCGGAGAFCSTNQDCVDDRLCIGVCSIPPGGSTDPVPCFDDGDCPPVDGNGRLCTQQRCA